MKIAIHRLARRDLAQATRWYDRQRRNLGDEFLQVAALAVEWIRAHPETGIVMGSGIRMYSLERFPYGIVFENQTAQIRILAFHHHKRRSGYWHRRRRHQ